MFLDFPVEESGKNRVLNMFSRNITAIIGHIKMPTLSTVNQFTQKQPAFTTSGLRSLIFNEHSNGLAQSGGIIRVGRKVLINEEKFFGWIEAQNQGAKS